MAVARDALRDWHRLFGLILTDFFTGSPFIVEIERDLSKQQQFLDVLILRRGRGPIDFRLPDGLDDLLAHNLVTFKSHHETLDGWAMKELVGHYVAYRKLASTSPSELLPEDQFRLYAVCARFPDKLSRQVAWRERQAGAYDCRWGTDEVRVIVPGQLPREPQNALLHLFSASRELVGFGQGAYRRRSQDTSQLLGQLFQSIQGEGFAMSYTMQDFRRDYIKEHLPQLPPEERRDIFESLPPKERRKFVESLPPAERRELVESLPPAERRKVVASLSLEERLAGLSAAQIRKYLNQLPGEQRPPSRTARKKRGRGS